MLGQNFGYDFTPMNGSESEIVSVSCRMIKKGKYRFRAVLVKGGINANDFYKELELYTKYTYDILKELGVKAFKQLESDYDSLRFPPHKS